MGAEFAGVIGTSKAFSVTSSRGTASSLGGVGIVIFTRQDANCWLRRGNDCCNKDTKRDLCEENAWGKRNLQCK